MSGFVISGWDATEVFEFIEEALNVVTIPIEHWAEAGFPFFTASVGDVRRHALGLDLHPDPYSIIGLAGQTPDDLDANLALCSTSSLALSASTEIALVGLDLADHQARFGWLQPWWRRSAVAECMDIIKCQSTAPF